MFTMIMLWASEFQFPDWAVVVAAVVGIGTVLYLAKEK